MGNQHDNTTEASADNGGPAFPQISELGDIAATSAGMSLRDWFAGQQHITDEELGEAKAAAIMGGRCPRWTPDTEMHCIEWWAAAEAKLKYIKADAMLAARGKP